MTTLTQRLADCQAENLRLYTENTALQAEVDQLRSELAACQDAIADVLGTYEPERVRGTDYYSCGCCGSEIESKPEFLRWENHHPDCAFRHANNAFAASVQNTDATTAGRTQEGRNSG